jgi:nucleotidyltransferase/DNA polymerase involved in DNA repair
VQVVIEADEDDANGDPQSRVVHEVAGIERGDLSVDTLGLQLAEAKDLLQRVQKVLIEEQARRCLAERIACPQCHRPRGHKDSKTIVMRTLFGTVRLSSPRWYHCSCQAQPTRTFSPLAAALPERTTPELRYLQSKFAGLVSYGQSATLLAETLVGIPSWLSSAGELEVMGR